jgi:hypothetical protein
MSAQFTFLAQFKPKPAVLDGQLPMLAHKVMVHVPALIVHALQKKSVRISSVKMKIWHTRRFKILSSFC